MPIEHITFLLSTQINYQINKPTNNICSSFVPVLHHQSTMSSFIVNEQGLSLWAYHKIQVLHVWLYQYIQQFVIPIVSLMILSKANVMIHYLDVCYQTDIWYFNVTVFQAVISHYCYNYKQQCNDNCPEIQSVLFYNAS